MLQVNSVQFAANPFRKIQDAASGAASLPIPVYPLKDNKTSPKPHFEVVRVSTASTHLFNSPGFINPDTVDAYTPKLERYEDIPKIKPNK